MFPLLATLSRTAQCCILICWEIYIRVEICHQQLSLGGWVHFNMEHDSVTENHAVDYIRHK